MGGFCGSLFRLNGLAVMLLDWRKYREHGGKGLQGQAQPGQGERHLAPVYWLPVEITIAVICGIALNRLRYNTFLVI